MQDTNCAGRAACCTGRLQSSIDSRCRKSAAVSLPSCWMVTAMATSPKCILKELLCKQQSSRTKRVGTALISETAQVNRRENQRICLLGVICM